MSDGLRRVAFGAAVFALAGPAYATPDFAAPATPPGVTVEPTIRGMQMQAGVAPSMTPAFFADGQGFTLYTFSGDKEPGKSACSSDCATAWPAVIAPANAAASGDWTLAVRADGARQWAYQGKPLYRSARDTKPGDKNGQGAEDGAWQVAALDATFTGATPGAVTVRAVANALGDVFVDYRGMTLYVFDGDATPGKSACADACAHIWLPLAAGGLAKPVGEWTIVARDDGMRQWAYKGRPLYAFSGDAKPGDAKGAVVDPSWHAAAVKRYFLPAEIRPRLSAGMMVLATADGMTLYARDKFRFSFGGYSVNDGPPATPAIGRAIGPGGCAGECTETWKPVPASADAQPSGYWSIAVRDDGTRQWAYQGYPVYTSTKDKRPGDMAGRDIFDLTDGSNALYWRPVTP
jgi:predicted lipoprotein with Yx(FWY)xxD motif